MAALLRAVPVRQRQSEHSTSFLSWNQPHAHAGSGYTGCSPSLQLAELSGSYESDGPSRVACREGVHVVYPMGAPGSAYNPIGDADAPGPPHDVRPALPATCKQSASCFFFAFGLSKRACFCCRQAEPMDAHCMRSGPQIPCHSMCLALVHEGRLHDNCIGAQGGLGSLRPVSVQDCQVACEMAQPACTSFAYNEVMAACFLKRGGGRATCISPTSICTEQVQGVGDTQ